jgi:hypothetical protein
MRPKGNGLIPLHDEKQEERGFFCIKLVQFLNTEAEMGTDEYKRLWDERFSAAKSGSCFYRNRCPIYERTVKNRCVTMGRKINIEEVRGFLEASNRQFDQGGIYLERALFKRDDNGVLTGITLSYEDRTTSDTQETRKEKQV